MSPIVLRAATVEWLAELPGETAADDLEKCYGFSHPLNAERKLIRETIDDRDDFRWWLEILDASGATILDGPLSRQVLRDEQLRSRMTRGPVVYNHRFELRPTARRQGIATRVYEAEGELYRRWGLREIHMTAMHDGLEVWVKKFGFLPANAGALAAEYPGWARARGQPLEPPLDIREYPADFLRSRNQLDLYKVLT